MGSSSLEKCNLRDISIADNLKVLQQLKKFTEVNGKFHGITKNFLSKSKYLKFAYLHLKNKEVTLSNGFKKVVSVINHNR